VGNLYLLMNWFGNNYKKISDLLRQYLAHRRDMKWIRFHELTTTTPLQPESPLYQFNLISALYIMAIYDIMAIYPTLTIGTLLE
jgi:hypothetical protein